MNRIQADGKQAGDTVTDDSLSSIWFFAWKRMTQSIPVDDASDVEYALCHTAAVEALLQPVDQEGIRAIFGIATFAFIDVYKEPFAAWSRHLKGARAVLDLHSPTPERFAELCSEINGLQEVVSLLCWYDSTGLMIRRDRGLIFEDWHRNLMVDDLFDLVGCPKDVYQIFTIIVKEGFKCESRHPDLYVTATEQLLKTSRGSHDQGDLLQDAWRYSSVMAIYEAESSVKTASFEAIIGSGRAAASLALWNHKSNTELTLHRRAPPPSTSRYVACVYSDSVVRPQNFSHVANVAPVTIS
ncbi:hypothetical protein CNYM01_03955 [Colletotrichum nymphaeae SA-01]|uniref:Uncharacterized protein n=1 Tax=Colletotrichum nymphaeae SA-01 TaxID=1460502 RepID=A0A135TCY3_9PEZI|nr:hypothetical protein CNYM01_03955 [Colletotrichum nymphaeae SA-01]